MSVARRVARLALASPAILALVGAAPAAGRDRQAPGTLTLRLKAAPTHLVFADGALRFCEGGRARIAADGRVRDDAPAARCATPDEPNAACSGVVPEIDVRAPAGGADDILDWEAWSLPMTGRVHACAAAGRTAVIATGSRVVLARLDGQSATVLARHGADRVAIAPEAVAWAHGRAIVLKAGPP